MSPLPARLRAYGRARACLLLGAAAIAGLLVVARARSGVDAGDAAQSLAAALRERGLAVDPATIVFFGDGDAAGGESEPGLRPLLGRSALLLGARPGELPDVYAVRARTTASGAVLHVIGLTNLTRTSSAAEEALARAGHHAVYASRVGDAYDAFTVLDLRGEPREATADWPLRARVQNAITNLQETGRTEAFGRVRYALATPAASLALRFEGEGARLLARADGSEIAVDLRTLEPVAGAERVEVRRAEKAMPGHIPWVVDTVRNTSFIGPAPIEWLEHTVFGVRDRLARVRYALFGDDAAGAAEEAASELLAPTVGAATPEDRARLDRLTAADPEIGWPPAPVAPLLDPPLAGEGQWTPVRDDPFVRDYPNAPPAFYQTFLRADRERGYARTYVTAWDPRLVQLHIAMGTREPESATGETGTGLVPRDDFTLTHLVGAFNGGFQALHGEFGMMSEGRVYLPPKPWAATVAVFDDGRVGMGSWPAPPSTREYDEGAATRQIPVDMIAMRQNLTSVVEDGRINPWQRWWWGAAPEAATEQTFTHRSGLCLTREGFLAYFWGGDMGPDALGEAMNAVRCVRGMHLDMNSKHTAFEFYRVAREGEALPPVPESARGEAFFEGPLPHAESAAGRYTVRARKAVRSMDPMRFPRYIRRDPRDFFFLTLRPVLPGPDLPTGERFATRGLPHAGWPHAFARTRVSRSWVVRVDPHRAIPGPVARPEQRRVLATISGARSLAREGAQHALYQARTPAGLRYGVGRPPAGARVIVAGPAIALPAEDDAAPEQGRAGDAEPPVALGVDADGFVLYVERAPGEPLSTAWLLRRAGARAALALPAGSRLALAGEGGGVGVDGDTDRDLDTTGGLLFLAEERPAAEVLFPDVTPMPYSRWGRLQGARVRYFPDPNRRPRFVRPATAE
jgi:hypothetical protein